MRACAGSATDASPTRPPYAKRAAWQGKRALFLVTRSSAILDLDALGPTEIVILCPTNHSPPIRAVPHLGGRGCEAVATCVAPSYHWP